MNNCKMKRSILPGVVSAVCQFETESKGEKTMATTTAQISSRTVPSRSREDPIAVASTGQIIATRFIPILLIILIPLHRPYVPPPIDPTAIEKESYIPYEFAQAKVLEVSSDLQILKLGYENYIQKLQSYHSNLQQENREHYEKYIMELKKKALARIEHEKLSSIQQIQNLQQEILKKEEQMEDLRDINASRVSEYQSIIHNLKDNLMENERQSQQDKRARVECQGVLFELLEELETREMRELRMNLLKESELFAQRELNEKEELKRVRLAEKQEMVSRFENEIAEIREGYRQREEDEREVKAVLEEALKRIEMDAWEGIGKRVSLLEEELSSSQQESVERLERLSAEREEKISQLTATHEEQMKVLQEEIEKLREESEELKRELQQHLQGEEENSALAGQLSSEIQQRDQSILLLRGQVVRSGSFPIYPLSRLACASSPLTSVFNTLPLTLISCLPSCLLSGPAECG
jgi:hypothetical protein